MTARTTLVAALRQWADHYGPDLASGVPEAMADAHRAEVLAEAAPPCAVCETPIEWVACPTGGWWAHHTHPEDGHDAQPPGTDVPALLAEVKRLRAERDAFADRVDTLTAVAKSNKRHVQTLAAELETAQARVAKLEQQAAVVAEFVAARAEYITSILNCHPDNGHDYNRWQGHAESRRQLAETLGLPVAWPPAVEDGARS